MEYLYGLVAVVFFVLCTNMYKKSRKLLFKIYKAVEVINTISPSDFRNRFDYEFLRITTFMEYYCWQLISLYMLFLAILLFSYVYWFLFLLSLTLMPIFSYFYLKIQISIKCKSKKK
jgi:hypothetical protein